MAIKEHTPLKEGELFHRYIWIPGCSGNPEINRIGGKAYHLAELQKLDLPVPPYFVMTTEGWKDHYQHPISNENNLPHVLNEQLKRALLYFEKEIGNRHFGDDKNPLFVSVRSGSPVSMPGAMHTIVNVGITDENVHVLGREIGMQNAHYAQFTLIRQLGRHAYSIADSEFSSVRDGIVGHDPVKKPEAENYQNLVNAAKAIFRAHGFQFPETPEEQLARAVNSVYRSWDLKEAIEVRFERNIPSDLGTAVLIQEMAWGNSNLHGAGSGVLFTRNPTTGEPTPMVVYAPHGQGSKVVGDKASQKDTSLNQVPWRYRKELTHVLRRISAHYPRPQEIEFTVDSKLHILQTRDVDLSTIGEFRLAKEQIEQGKVTEEMGKKRFSLAQLEQLLIPGLDQQSLERVRKEGRCIGKGVALSPTWAKGRTVFSKEEAEQYKGVKVILVADMTPKDFRDLPSNVVGVVSETGSVGSHKARAATKLPIAVIFGISIDRTQIKRGKIVTISGDTQEVFLGKIKTSPRGGLLTKSERLLVKRWKQSYMDNPWGYLSPEHGAQELSLGLQMVLDRAREQFCSRKAQGIEVFNNTVPEEIRIPYTVFKKDDIESIRREAQQALRSGSDVTVRTCRYPDTRGTSPYVVITNEEELKKFFADAAYSEKHGGWPQWMTDKTITEVVVGKIPKNKLNPSNFEHLCNWTLSCVAGKIFLQIVPGSPLLRSQEEIKPADMITIEALPDPSNVEVGLRFVQMTIGENLTEKSSSDRFLHLVSEAVFGVWWKKHNLALHMAALTSVFSHGTLVPSMEGQGSIKNGQEYVVVYGAKLDNEDEE